MQQNKIADGQRTKTIYQLIEKAKYQEVSPLPLRPSTSSATNSNFAPGADPCPSSPTATT